MREQKLSVRLWRFFAVALIFFFTSSSFAQSGPTSLNISGGLFQSNGLPITNSSVNFRLDIYDPSGTCLLYSEFHNGEDLSNTRGGFSLELGQGTGASNLIDLASPAALTSKVFMNTGAPVGPWAGCAAPVTMNSGDSRRIRVSYDLGGGYVAMTPDVPIASSAYSMVAETLQGKTPTDFVQVRDDGATVSLSQANLENIFSFTNYPKLDALVSGTSNQYMVANPSAAVGFNNQRITNVGTPSAAGDAATKGYADGYMGGKQIDLQDVGTGTGGGKVLVWDAAQSKWVAQAPAGDSTKLPLAGGTMSGAIDMNGNNILNSGDVKLSAQKTLYLGTFDNAQEATLVGTLDGTKKGATWYNSQSNELKVWNGSAAVVQAYLTSGKISASWIPDAIGAGAGSYGSATQVPTFTVGADGRITAASNVTISGVTPGGAAGGDLTGTYPNPSIKADAVTTAKILDGEVKTADIADANVTPVKLVSGVNVVNRMFLSDGITGGTFVEKICAQDEVLKYNVVGGWNCETVTNLSPVKTVEGRTGNIDIDLGDIQSAGTAAARNVGTAVGDVVSVQAGGKLPVLDGSNLTAVNAVKLQGNDISNAAPNASDVLMWNNTTSKWEPASIPSAPAYTSSNVGVGGVGVFKQKTGTNFEFKNVNAGSNKVVVTNDAANNEIDVDIDQTKIDHDQLLNFVANEHVDHSSVSVATAAGSSGLSGGGDLTATRNLVVDITGTSALGAAADNADEVMIYDTSASALKKVTRAQLNLSEAEVDAMVGNNGYAADTNVLKKDGSVALTGNFQTGGKWLSNDGGNEGVWISSTGDVGIGTSAPAEKLEVAGAIRIGTTATTCDASHAGGLRYNGGNMEFCDGAGSWIQLGTAAGGEVNTASNQGAGGVGLYLSKSGVDLQFKNINAGSNKITVTNDAANKEVDIDVDQTKIDHDQLLNFVANEHVDHSSVSVATAAGTSGLSGGGNLTATRNLAVDITGTSALGAAADNADEIMIYDTSASALKKVTRAQLALSEAEVDAFVGNNGYAADNMVLKKDGSVALTADWDVGAKKLKNLAAPTLAGDAVTKSYADGKIGGSTLDLTGLGDGQVLKWDNTASKWVPYTIPAGVGSSVDLTSEVTGILPVANGGTGLNSISGDWLSQYALLAGRAGGQALTGGTAASEKLTLESTSNATKGQILLNPNGGTVGIGVTNPVFTLDISGGSGIRVRNTVTDAPQLSLVNTNQSWQIFNNGALGNYFDIFDQTASQHRLVIDTSGNVGLGGILNPGRNLHVNGIMRLEPVAVSGGAAGDIIIDSGNSNALRFHNGTGWVTVATSSTAGESNTASNQGAGGVGLYLTKSGVDLQFKNINAGSNKITVANDAANKEVDIDIDQTKIDHDQLLNFVANEHVDHSSVSISTAAGTSGLGGGGNLTATRNLVVDITGTSALGAAADNADEVMIYDTSASALKKVTRAQLNLSEAEVDAMVGNNGYAADNIVLKKDGSVALTADWDVGAKKLKNLAAPTLAGDAVTKSYADGKIGGSTLDLTGLGDGQVLKWDNTASKWVPYSIPAAGESNTASNVGSAGIGVYKQKTGVNLEFKKVNAASNKIVITDDAANSKIDFDIDQTKIDHDQLLNFVANEHVDHSSVSVATAAGTSGLSGGGNLTATRNLVVDITGTSALGAAADNADEILVYDTSASALKKVTRSQLNLSEAEVDAMVGNNGYAADSSVLKKDGSVAMTGNFKLGGQWLSNDGGSEGIWIDTAGKVGIGTSSVPGEFNVAGKTYLTPSSAGASQGMQMDVAGLANGSNGIYVNAPTGWTGNVIKSNLNGVEQFAIAQDGSAWFKGSVGIGMASPAEKLEVGGAIRIGTTATTCDASHAGGLRYNGGNMEFCNGGGSWVALGTAAGGEVNTASNQGAGGVGLYLTKSGVDLQFKNINAGSNKVTVTNDAGNKEIDIDIDQTKIDHDQLLNFVANEHVDHSSVSIATAAGTSGLSGGGNLTATRNLVVDITGTTALGATADNADEILIYDASATALKKVTRAQLNLSESEVDAMVGNNGYAADNIVLKKDGSVALTADWDVGAKKLKNLAAPTLAGDAVTKSYADGKIGGSTLDLTGLGDGQVLKWDNTASKWVPYTIPAGGEANTVSNIGAAGVGIYKQKTGVNFELKKVNAGSNKVSITDDTTNNEVDVDVNEANLTLGNIGGTLPVNKGGTGQTSYTDGQLLIGNSTGNTLAKATLTQGSGITVTNGAGSITIASTLGTSVDLTSEVTGVLPIANGGTGTNSISGDWLSQYALLAGRAGGQNLIGGTAASENLKLESTSNGTKGYVLLQPNGGNVGIGTTTPTRLLEVSGASSGTSLIAPSTAAISIYNTDSTNNNTTDLAFRFTDSASVAQSATKIVSVTTNHTAGSWAGDLAFVTSSAATSSEKMRITGSGNVGIGTTNPSGKLDVEGGEFYLPAPAAAPADANFANNQMSVWLDETNNEFEFKARKADGTYINRTLGASGGGEANTVSNIGAAGVGIYKQKTGVNFELKKVNAGSNKITITDDTTNNEVDVDVNEANLTLDNIGGTLSVNKGGTGATSLTDNRLLVGNGTAAVGVLAAGSAGQMLQSGGASDPAWSTATYPSTTTANQLLYSSANNTVAGLATANSSVLITNGSGVPSFSALSADNFTQYALLAGRAGGQNLIGGTAASENLSLESTSNATKGYVLLQQNGGNVGIGTASPGAQLEISKADSSNILRVQNTTSSAARWPGIEVRNYLNGQAAGHPTFSLQNAGGTSAARTALSSGKTLGSFSFDGALDASTYASGAGIYAVAAGAFSASSSPAYMVFETTASGATTGTERLRLHSAGGMRLAPSGLPGSPAAGDIIIDSGANNTLKFHNGSSWVSLSAGGSGDVNMGGNNPVSTMQIGTLNNNSLDFLVSGTVRGGFTTGGVFSLAAVNGSGEGAEVSFTGSTSYDNWTVDLNNNNMRFTTNSTNTNNMILSNSGTGAMNLGVEGWVGAGLTSASRPLHVGGAMRLNPSGVPSSPAAGDIYIDNGANVLKYHNGSSWVSVVPGLAAVTNAASLTNGKIWIGDSGGLAQEQSLSGDVTMTNAGVTTIANNAVSNAKFRQGVARSVVGVAGNATANVADIQGSANQVLRVDSAGTGLAFGSINLASSSAVTGTLAVANGGTGQTSFTDGQLLIGNSTGNTLSKATLTQGSGITVTNGGGSITIASTLGTSVDLTSEVTGTLPVANGGTGQTSVSGDWLSQYALLAGRAGGQNLRGGTAASENLTLESTSNATKGYVNLQPNGGNVGIGTAAPGSKLDIVGTDASYISITNTASAALAFPGVSVTHYRGSTDQGGNAAFVMKTYRGISGARVAAASGDVIGGFNFWSYDGAAARNGANMFVTADGAWSSGSAPTAFTFQTVPSGSTTAADRMRIDNAGNVGIGTTTPVNLLHLEDTSSTGTPALRISGSGGTTAVFLGDSNSGAGAVTGLLSLRNAGTTNVQLAASGDSYFTGGSVGIGTSTPRVTLDVSGPISSKPSVAEASGVVDFGLGNIAHTTANCGAFRLDNMKDGATYTLAVKGTSSATACSFTAWTGAGTGTSLTVHMPPDHTVPVATKHTLYSFIVSGNDVYVSWIRGY